MDNDTMTSLLTGLSVALAGLAAFIAWLQVKPAQTAAEAAKTQVKVQEQLAKDAAQPYVWADVRGSEHTGFLLEVVVGNSGQTVATDVRVRFDPPLPVARDVEEKDASTRTALERLEKGLRSLSPGKTLRWTLGGGPDLLAETGPQAYTVTVEATGPFGPVPPLEYVIDLSDFRESADRPDGSLHLLTDAVSKGMKSLKDEMYTRR